MKKARRTARYTVANIDSLNFASPSILFFFIYNKNYVVEKIDKTKKEDRQRWFNTFGKQVKTNNKYPWVELYIINSLYGDTLPVKLHNKDRDNYRIEFAGIHNYGTKQTDFIRVYQDIESSQTHAFIKRIDIAIDSIKRIPSKAITELKKHRPHITKVHNTTYYNKSIDKNGKVIQSNIKIRTYNKSKKENLSDKNEDIMRLEFQFPGSFFQITKNGETKKLTIKDLDTAIKKMEKYIKKMTFLNAKIDISFSKLLLENDTENHTSNTDNTHTEGTSTEYISQNTLNTFSLEDKLESILQTQKIILDNQERIENKLDDHIADTKKEKNTSVSIDFMKTKNMAINMEISESFLEKNMGKIFCVGTHYYQPSDARLLRWDVKAMHLWLKGGHTNEEDQELLSKLLD
ncbi:MAG: hypothetical protein B6D54_02025 [Epsilonproteobacteria bacterium 4484_65]|nr:MAG: hypothetical protein B6D54_02025 [Epsilonproteobacteria bacterium 4484_65]